jgi:hypothetical protein
LHARSNTTYVLSATGNNKFCPIHAGGEQPWATQILMRSYTYSDSRLQMFQQHGKMLEEWVDKPSTSSAEWPPKYACTVPCHKEQTHFFEV